MLAIIITVLITFFVSSLFGYVLHKSLHQQWSGRLHTAHMNHHLLQYPPSNYLSEVYRDAGADSTPKFFLIGALPLIIAPIVLWAVGWLPLSVMITALVVEALMGFLHNYLHDAFHIRDHWLYRVPLINKVFKRWVHIHFIHHVKMESNYGIFYFMIDRLLGTYQDQ
jgi:sterol desaturase/sphingolipid hydroxylase (fatty acid hydroxylase superfamily)